MMLLLIKDMKLWHNVKDIPAFSWIDPQDHSKGFKLNFSEVTYVEVARTPEGYKQVEFVALRHPELALDYDYPQSFISPQMA